MNLANDRPALAVILGRAGSKGVPGKNMMPIAGKPCAAWTIEHAQTARSVGRIVLSTDDLGMMMLGREMGVEVVERSRELASDTATVDAAAREAVRMIERRAPGPSPVLAEPRTSSPGETGEDAVGPIVILYANVPVRPTGLIDRAVARMLETDCDSVQSYAPVGKLHPWWTARVDEAHGRVRPWEGDVLNHGVYRRQDLPPAYIPDGGVLVVTRRALFGEIPDVPPGPHAFFGLDRRGVINREGQVVDIDSPIDVVMAEAILNSPG